MADQPYSGPEVEAAIRILREDAQAARDRRLMERLDSMEERLGRMPVQELTAEEKAAEYDRLMAAQKAGQSGAPAPTGGGGSGAPAPSQGGAPAGKTGDDGKPPAPAPKPPTPPADTTVRKSWWDGYQSQGG